MISPMVALSNADGEILRAAIAWSLSIADAAGETLIAAILAEALCHAEQIGASGGTDLSPPAN